jgi:hypothetical protein
MVSTCIGRTQLAGAAQKSEELAMKAGPLKLNAGSSCSASMVGAVQTMRMRRSPGDIFHHAHQLCPLHGSVVKLRMCGKEAHHFLACIRAF